MAKTHGGYPGEPSIAVEMLGCFKITFGDIVISDSMSRTKQVWNLLEYLVAHRGRRVSSEEIIGVLWPAGAGAQPANALKNLIYRIRTLFSTCGVASAKDIILYERGCYGWNNRFPTTVDVEEFCKLCYLARDESVPDEHRIPHYLRIIELYKGEFLTASRYEGWVLPLREKYAKLHLQCALEAVELLQKAQKFDAVYEVCATVLQTNPFDERLHIALISAQLSRGEQAQALEHYREVTDMFYRELGVSPGENLRSIYRDISRTVNSVETDLMVIKEDLEENSWTTGAYYCDYEVFKNIYRVEARTLARSGDTAYVSLLTLADKQDGSPETKLLDLMMGRLLEVIRGSLRKGDVVTRFSAAQYIIMLPTVTYESGSAVIGRIVKRFRAENSSGAVRLYARLLPLDPVEPLVTERPRPSLETAER